MSDDRMTVEEIRLMYKEAKDKPAQIGILADINLCSPAIIQKIIRGELDELPPIEVRKSKQKVKSMYPRGRNNPITAKEKETIVQMYLNGSSAADIANAIKRSITAVKSYIKKYREENKEVDNVIFAEELAPDEREKLTEEVQNTAAVPVDEVQTYEFASEGDVGSIAGGILEAIAELYASGYVVSVQTANEKGVIAVVVEKGVNFACLKRRMSSNDKS